MNEQMQDGYQLHHPLTDLMVVVCMLFASKVQPNGFLPVPWGRGYHLVIIKKQTNK
jgi:hypothetical protein